MKEGLLCALCVVLGASAGFGAGQRGQVRGETNASTERMEEWNDWKFGMFIHWGAYAQAAPGNGRMGALLSKDPAETKRGLEWYKTFNPVKYDPQQWARKAKAAGVRYAVLTAKHHDGFCNWISDIRPNTIGSPDCPWSKSANPDIVREFLKAFRAEGIKVGLYFSHLNWSLPEGGAIKRHPNYDPDFINKYPDQWARYVRIAKEQVHELVSNYGELDMIWFDIHYPDGRVPDAMEMLKMVREHQGNIIINNRGTGEYVDFQVQEQFIPDAPPRDYWELNIPMTKNGGFWYKGPDAEYRNAEELIPMFADIVHKGGNFLLNIGPKGDGSIPQGELDALASIGEWMDDNGEAIYGTKASPWGRAPKWGKITRKGQRLYLLVSEWKGGKKLPLALDADKIVKAQVLKTGRKVSFVSAGDGVEFEIPSGRAPSKQVSVIAVDFKGDLDVTADWPTTKRVKVHHFDSEIKAEKEGKSGH